MSKPEDNTNNTIGHIAAIRAMMAAGQHELETIIVQSRRALKYLDPNNVPVRTITGWTLGYAYQLQGNRDAASRAYNEVLSISEASGDIISTLASTTGLGNIQESENQLYGAAESYRRQHSRRNAQPVDKRPCSTTSCAARCWKRSSKIRCGRLSSRCSKRARGVTVTWPRNA